MVKKVKKKSGSKVVASKSSAPRSKAALAKYDQPGAPWWKRVPAPPPKQ